jgi:MatE.
VAGGAGVYRLFCQRRRGGRGRHRLYAQLHFRRDFCRHSHLL